MPARISLSLIAILSAGLMPGCASPEGRKDLSPEPSAPEEPGNQANWLSNLPSQPYAEQSESTRDAMARMVGYFPNFALKTHEGETLRFYDDLVLGKKVVINFMYTVCDGI